MIVLSFLITHLFYCQDFSSMIIGVLFPNLNKISISLQMYKVMGPQLPAETPHTTSEWKKSNLWIVKWTPSVNIQTDSILFLYPAVQIMDILSLWHITWWWDLPFNFSFTIQFMITNNERAVWLLTGKSGHEAILASLQSILNECHLPCICLGLVKPFHPC